MAKRMDPTDPTSTRAYTKQQFIQFYGEGRGKKMFEKGAPEEKRPDPTMKPGSKEAKKLYSRAQFIEFYGPQVGSQRWREGGVLADKKAERRRDPTDKKGKKTYTLREFTEFYGPAQAAKLWKKAGGGDQEKRVTVPLDTPWGQKAGCARAVRVGNTVSFSGTCDKTGATAAEQVTNIFGVIAKGLEAAGSSLADVVHTRMFASNVSEDWQSIGEAHAAVFKESGNIPACTLVGGALLIPEFKVEIECTAIRGSAKKRQTVALETPWGAKAGCARAVKVGTRVWVSGTCDKTGATTQEQLATIFGVMGKAVDECKGAGAADMIHTRMWAADVAKDWQGIGDAHLGVFKESGNTPACTLVGGSLLIPEFKIEIECQAVTGSAKKRTTVALDTAWGQKAGCARCVCVGREVTVSGTCDKTGADAAEQVKNCFGVIGKALEEAGTSLADVVHTRMFASDVSKDWQSIGEAHAAVFSEVGNTPACTLVGGSLLIPEFKIEVECTAVKGSAVPKKKPPRFTFEQVTKTIGPGDVGLGWTKDEKTSVITAVEDGKAAAIAGVAVGWKILAVAGKKVRNAKKCDEALKEAGKEFEVTFSIRTDNRPKKEEEKKDEK